MRYAIKLHHVFAPAILFAAAGAPSSTLAGEATVGDSGRGAVSWSQNCGRCHELRDPSEFRDDLWPPIVTHMRIRAGLTGQQQRDIVAFLQASNSPRVARHTTKAANSLSGQAVYEQTCIACHGADGRGAIAGVPGFSSAGGPMAKTDAVLLQSITHGLKTPGNPISMPAKGGNPALGDEELRAVLAYLRKQFDR